MLALVKIIVLVATGICWLFAAFCAIKARDNMKDSRAWGSWFPITYLMPSFFTEEGNRHRVNGLKATMLSILLVMFVSSFDTTDSVTTDPAEPAGDLRREAKGAPGQENGMR